jgi:hypothetical protein
MIDLEKTGWMLSIVIALVACGGIYFLLRTNLMKLEKAQLEQAQVLQNIIQHTQHMPLQPQQQHYHEGGGSEEVVEQNNNSETKGEENMNEPGSIFDAEDPKNLIDVSDDSDDSESSNSDADSSDWSEKEKVLNIDDEKEADIKVVEITKDDSIVVSPDTPELTEVYANNSQNQEESAEESDDESAEESDDESDSESKKNETMESYEKMKVSALRDLVQTKGLVNKNQSITRMRKSELIELLN